jgi:hypothetical protein
MAPEKFSKVPRTLLTTRCRTVKPTFEWTGSMAQVPVDRGAVTLVVMREILLGWDRSIRCRFGGPLDPSPA